MKKKMVVLSLAFVLALLPLSAGHAKPFYEGKIITLIVATKPGGGYDYYGRLMAKFTQKHLPGSTIIVKNVPGAGNIIGTNEIYLAKANGFTFGTFNRGLALSQVAELKGVKFDLTKMSWLGSPCSEVYSFLISNKFKKLDDVLKADKIRLAATGLGGVNYVIPLLFAHMMGNRNFTLVSGYAGGEQDLAVIRGEMDGVWGSWASRQGLAKSGDAHPILFLGKKQPAGYEDVPLIQDVVTEAKHKPVLDLLFGMNMVGRPFAGPPGIPKDRLTVLRDAFRKACHDPELLKMAKKADRPVDYVSPDQAVAWAKSIMDLPPEMVDVIKGAYGQK